MINNPNEPAPHIHWPPIIRPRRLRTSPWIRNMVSEHRVTVNDLIWPVFIQEGTNLRTPIASMPGVERLSIDLLILAVKEARDLGIPAIALFPATPTNLKTQDGEEAFNPENLVCRTIRAIKSAVPDIGVICDVALDPYTSHGQDGLVRNGIVVNDETVEVLCKQSVVQARAGCDVIAPSDMMDGRVGAIRKALDNAGFS
ncbi:porphobilinogen synthase, partial [bacterium]|nr:porphobilinogen synthase [bacterium]